MGGISKVPTLIFSRVDGCSPCPPHAGTLTQVVLEKTPLKSVVMAALRSRCGHYIFVLFLFSFFFLFFPHLSQRSQIGCLLCFYTWCGPSANLECRSEMWGTQLIGNTGHKTRQKFAICNHRTTLLGHIFAIKARIDNRKKILLNSNISSACPTIWWTSAH